MASMEDLKAPEPCALSPSSSRLLELGRCYVFRRDGAMFLEEILADSKENDGGGGTSPHHICGLVRDYSESDQAYLIELEGLKRTWMQSSSIRIAAAFGREGDDKILPTPVTFEDCVGKQVKVWWEEDGCFYPGVVLETKEQPVHGGERSGKHGTSFGHQFRPVVNLVDGSGSSSKSNGKGEGEEEAKATKLEKAVKVNYPYDNVEEWVPFHSKNLYWIDHQIEVRIPQSYFRETERGGIDREIASKDSNQNTTYDAASSALGWRVAVNGCQYGYVTNSVEVVPTTGKEEEEEEETKVCRVGDGEVRDVKLQILLDSGFLCSKETKMAYPSRLVVQQEGKKGKEEEGLDSDNLLWFQPPQMNFDFFHQLQRKLLENSERKDPEDRTEDVSVQVTYWDPLDSFRSKLVRLSWRYSVFKLCFRVITQGLDLKGEELLQYLSTPDVDGLQDRKELDLRESMIQWPAEILNGIESTSRVESELQKQKQYYLFGSTFAFAPFAGHSIQHPDALAAYGKRIAEGMRILILEFSGELIEEKTFQCRSGIILNEIVSGSFDVLFDSSNASEKITLEENSKQSRMYVDVLGRAGALERTSSCLPFLLPIISGAVEGYFIPSRGLVLCKGYGMSPKDFVHLGGAQIDNDSLRDALDAILVKDCKKTVYHELAGLETISGKQVRVTLGYWLNLHKISFSKTVYWKLWESHKSGLVNSALREPIIHTLKPFAGQPSTDDYLQEQDKANAENHLFLFDTNTNLKGEIQKLKFELFGEGDIEDPVIALLFEEWIQANKTKLSLTVGHKTLSGDLGRVKQMYQQCTLSGRALNLRLDTRKDPALQWYHLLFKQTHEALDLMKDYLSDFEEIQRGKPNWERGHGRSKISSESFANKYYQSIDTIDLLIDIIRYAKAKPTQPPSLFSFERKGSVFQYLFWFAQNIFKVLAVCTRQRANGWLEYLDVSPNGEISRVEKEKVKRDFLHKRKRDQKAQRATAELQKYPKEHEALVQLLTDHLAQHPTELERIKKYVTSQSAHFGAIPERLPKDEEISVLQFYYDKLLEKGPTAKSTSINWLIKYLKGVDYDQMRKSSSIVVITNFLKWVVSLHRWEKTPTSFFKYKAYFPYFWAYARGDFLNNLREEKKRFHSGGKPKKAAEQDNVQTLKSQAMIDEPKPGQGTPITSGSLLKGQIEQGGDPLQEISFDPLLQNESPETQMSDKEALRSLLSKNPEVTFKEAAPILCTFLPISDEELQSILKNETDNALQVKELLDKDSFLKDSYLSKFNLSPDAKKAMLQCLVDTQRLLFTKEEIELNKKRQAQEENEKPKKRKYKKRVRRTLDQILENPESLVETTRPTCLGCKCLCAVHRRDQKTGKVISWRCRTCCWQGMKAQLLRSSLGQDPGPST